MEIQVKLLTKQTRYAIPDLPYVVPGTVTTEELSCLVKSVLAGGGCAETGDLQFNFLVSGEYLCGPLHQHLDERNICAEGPIEVEYLTKHEAPVPQNSLIHDDWVSSVKATGNWILSGCYDNTLHIWDVGGKHKLTIPGHLAPVKSVAWIETGVPLYSFVSTSHDETAIIWQWNKEENAVECVHICKGHVRSVDCVAVNPAELKLVTGSYDTTLKVWSIDHDSISECVKESGDTKKTKTEEGKTKVKTSILTLNGHTDGVSGIQWTACNELCSCSLDSTLRLWDVELGGLKSQLNGSKAFLSLSYSEHLHHILTSSADRHIRLWDTRLKGPSVVKSVFSSHDGWVTTVKWSPAHEHFFVSGSYDHLLKLWDIRSAKSPVFDLAGHEDRVLSVDWSSDGNIVSGGADCHVKIFKH